MRRKGTLPQRTKVVQPAAKQSAGLFLPNLQTNLEQLVVGSIQLKEKNTEHTYTCAERALYRSAPRLCNLLQNSPADCFYQICKQIWSSLSLVQVH